MDSTKQYQEQQEAKRLQSKISSFIGDVKIGTLLNKSGTRKLRGMSPLTLFAVIFMLPFEGVIFLKGLQGTKPWASRKMQLTISSRTQGTTGANSCCLWQLLLSALSMC